MNKFSSMFKMISEVSTPCALLGANLADRNALRRLPFQTGATG